MKSAIILAVDDKPENLNLLFDLFDGAGLEVLVAQSGESALRRAAATQPNLILLDVMMAGIDGFETCRRLKASDATKEIPVIFMTAVTDLDEKIKGFELGAVDYVTKPIQPQEVVARVQTHLTIQRLQHDLKAALERERQHEKHKAELISMTSNILGTFMNSVTFSLDALKRNHDRMTPQERMQAFTRIEENLRHARAKVHDLLEIHADGADAAERQVPNSQTHQPTNS